MMSCCKSINYAIILLVFLGQSGFASDMLTFDFHQHGDELSITKKITQVQGDVKVNVTARSLNRRSADIVQHKNGLGIKDRSDEIDAGEALHFEVLDSATGLPILFRLHTVRLRMFEPTVRSESADIYTQKDKLLRTLNKDIKKRYVNVAGYGKDRHISGSWLLKTNVRIDAGFFFEANEKSQFYVYDLTLERINLPPVFESKPIVFSKEKVSYQYNVVATDEKESAILYSFENHPPGMAIDKNSGMITWIPGYHDAGTHSVTVLATDNEGAYGRQTFELLVENSNREPKFESKPIKLAREGVHYRYHLVASDADNESLFYRLVSGPDGLTYDESDRHLYWTPGYDQAGTHNISVAASDVLNETVQTFVLSVQDTNRAPEIISQPVTDAQENQPYSYSVVSTDSDIDTLTYSLSISPKGMEIEPSTGKINWLPNYFQEGSHEVMLTAKDAKNYWAEQRFFIQVKDINRAPKFDSTPLLTVEENSLYEYVLTAVDQDSDGITFELLEGPPGMILDKEGNQLSWLPGFQDAGSYTVKLSVKDNALSSEQTFTLTVLNTNKLPVIETDGLPVSREGEAYRFQVQAKDPVDNGVLSYRLLKFPAGMSISLKDGLIDWIPSFEQAGRHEVLIQVEDSDLGVVSKALLIKTENVNRAPAFVSNALLTVSENENYRYPLEGEDLDRDGVQFNLLNGPVGMLIEENVLYWVPGFEQAGEHPVTLSITDGVLTATQQFVVTVNNTNRSPVITSEAVVMASENSLYQYSLIATDADIQQLDYKLIRAPKGMTIDSETGSIQWLPTFDQAGEVFVIAEVRDDEMAVDTQQFTLHVANTNQAPTFTSAPLLKISENKVWRYAVTGQDPDKEPLQFTLGSGPAGMAINNHNTLMWEPDFEMAGSYPVTLTLSDGKVIVDQAFTVDVLNTNRKPQVKSIPISSASEGEPYRYQIIATDPDLDGLNYHLAIGPSGMQLDKQKGLIRWQPNYVQAGVFPIEVVIEDAHESSIKHLFSIEVSNSNQSPVIQSSSEQKALEGKPYRYEINSFDPDFDVLDYQLVNAPQGMILNAQQAAIYWHPGQGSAGSHNVSFSVSDGEYVVEQEFNLTVLSDTL